MWEPVLHVLARRADVVAVDLPGFGRSPALPGLWAAPLLREGDFARGRRQRLARRLRPVLPLLMLSRRVRRLALAHVVADPDRVPRAAAQRMVRSYARAPAYEATNAAMLATHFTGAEEIKVALTVAFGERDRMLRPVRLRVPGARTVMLPRCGHIPMWDDPERVARLVLETSGLGGAATGSGGV